MSEIVRDLAFLLCNDSSDMRDTWRNGPKTRSGVKDCMSNHSEKSLCSEPLQVRKQVLIYQQHINISVQHFLKMNLASDLKVELIRLMKGMLEKGEQWWLWTSNKAKADRCW